MALYRLDNSLRLFREESSAHAAFMRTLTEIQKFLQEVWEENKKQRENGDISSAISRLAGYIFVCNKYNCISCAKYVTNFLTHKSAMVTAFAAKALSFIMQMIKCAILNETNPSVRRGMKAELSGIISTIRHIYQYEQLQNETKLEIGNILELGQEILSLDVNIYTALANASLKESKQAIEEMLRENTLSNRKSDSDEFISSLNQSIGRLAGFNEDK